MSDVQDKLDRCFEHDGPQPFTLVCDRCHQWRRGALLREEVDAWCEVHPKPRIKWWGPFPVSPAESVGAGRCERSA